MPIRRTEGNGNRGYGSFGRNVTVFQDTEILMADELPFIYAEVEKVVSNGNVPYVFWVIWITWRWKFFKGQVNGDLLRTYDSRRDKFQLGAVSVSRDAYVSDLCYVAHSAQISELFTCQFCILAGGGEDERTPCDEPPSDTPLVTIRGTEWASSLNVPATSAAGSLVGDKMVFTPERSLQTYNFGGAYEYACEPYTQEEIDRFGFPVALVL